MNVVRHWYGAASAERQWVGTFACTIDGLPIIGKIGKRISMGVGFNGYGGSYMSATGLVLARLAGGKTRLPAWYDKHIFRPDRFVM